MILYHQTTIKPGYQAMLHVNATAQTCQIVSITPTNKKLKGELDGADDGNNQILRTGDRGLVRFRFMQRAEYLKIGQKLIFREGRTKGLGTVKEVFPIKDHAAVISPTTLDTPKSLVRYSTKDGSTKGVATGSPAKGHSR